MKIGFNLLLWTTDLKPSHRPLLRKIKAAGYDGVEVPVFGGTPADYQALGGMLDEIGLERTAVSVIPNAERNPLAGDKATRAAAVQYLKWIADCCDALDARIVCGPLHSTLGRFSGSGPTKEERKRAVAVHRAVGDHYALRNVRVALEAVNRFECYFLTCMDELADYLDEVDHPHITGMYDTFHSNIEEHDQITAIGRARRHISHVHISENNRGTPGKGHIEWPRVFAALRKIRYDGWLTIEAFGRALPELAAATRVWRDFFPTPESVYRDGIKHIRRGWSAAG
ncbi:MAG TPA: sugar phosphate isomerase/epimerase [Aestuariivirgaceae bacterium]|nr:sugar phosphate isomerase/epimerase [Aestuariivirgaceae bacterium]